MKVIVRYEDTDNEYEIPLDKLLKKLKVTPQQLERAVLNLLQES